jgi:hypothetical protein
MSALALADDLAVALDPVLLARRAGLEPDAWQERVLRGSAPRTLLNVSRQVGKSTTSAVMALHMALYEPGSLTLLLSPSLRQASELARKVLTVYRALGRPVAAGSETALTLELDNGSRIVALPGREETIRGYSGVRLLVIDEAARVPDALYYSVRPMLATSSGRLIALSTPFGKRGWWFTAWESGEVWDRVMVTAAECPRISRAFLAEEERTLGPFWFRQEYLCQFSETTDQLFGYDALMASVDPRIQPLFGGGPDAADEDR